MSASCKHCGGEHLGIYCPEEHNFAHRGAVHAREPSPHEDRHTAISCRKWQEPASLRVVHVDVSDEWQAPDEYVNLYFKPEEGAVVFVEWLWGRMTPERRALLKTALYSLTNFKVDLGQGQSLVDIARGNALKLRHLADTYQAEGCYRAAMQLRGAAWRLGRMPLQIAVSFKGEVP